MSDMRSLLVDSSRRLFADICTPDVYNRAEEGTWQPALWSALMEAGLPDAARSPERFGSGADLGDALTVIREAGAFCLPAPLAETMIAEMVLAAAGLAPCTGVLTVGPVVTTENLSIKQDGDTWLLSGNLHRIPWGRNAESIVILARASNGWATAVIHAPVTSHLAENFAREPRDDFNFNSFRISKESVSLGGFNPEELRFQGALFRLSSMVGALTWILHMTIDYALQRVQFGRPIAKFQAVQQQIAIMASQVGAASAAMDAAIDALRHGPAYFDIAAAKVRVGEAAGIAVGIAHQVHGAMGFTHEHALHRSTRRLWSWRDEFGSENEWAAWIGRVVTGLGAKGLWPFITSVPKTTPMPISDSLLR